MQRATFERQLRILSSAWPKQGELTPDRMAAYWIALSDLNDAVFEMAVARVLKQATFFPAPSEIRSTAAGILSEAGLMPVEPESAWIQVLKIVRRWPVRDLELDPNIKRAVDDIGGFRMIAMSSDDEIPFHRKAFLASYSEYRRRVIETDARLMAQGLPAGENDIISLPEMATHTTKRETR